METFKRKLSIKEQVRKALFEKSETDDSFRSRLLWLETRDFITEMWKIREIESQDGEKRFENHELEGWITAEIKDGDTGEFIIPKLGSITYLFDTRISGDRVLFLDIDKKID